MANIGPSHFVWLPFDRAGVLAEDAREALAAALADREIDDLVIVSHGWKNEKDDAEKLYTAIWTHAAGALRRLDASRILVAGVQWPAKRYATSVDSVALATAVGQAGGVLAAQDGQAQRDLTDAEFDAALARGADGLDIDLDRLRDAAEAYAATGDSEQADALMLELLAGGLDSDYDAELAPEAQALLNIAATADQSLQALAMPPDFTVLPSAGTAQGVIDDIDGWIAGRRAAVVRVLEQLSYFEMKKRAGTVGAGLGYALNALTPGRPLRLHLVGHSFGARVLTAAADTFRTGGAIELFSLTLLQGAFSHNGLSAKRDGAFHRVIGKPSGPISITHTHNDWACTRVYALASRLSRDVTKKVGDRDDQFGSMGANGAQFAPDEPDGRSAAESSITSGFAPARGKVTNFLADAYICDPRDAHNDVGNATVGALVAAAIEA